MPMAAAGTRPVADGMPLNRMYQPDPAGGQPEDAHEPLLPAGVAELAEPDPGCVEHAGLRLLMLRGWYMRRQMMPGADERDGHRQEDQRLGDVLALGPVGEHGDGETDRRGEAVTTMTHQMLLTIEPRSVASTRHDARKNGDDHAAKSDAGPFSNADRPRRPLTTPTTRPITGQGGDPEQRLPKMLPHSSSAR